jgi:FkbM family methyltransferase
MRQAVRNFKSQAKLHLARLKLAQSVLAFLAFRLEKSLVFKYKYSILNSEVELQLSPFDYRSGLIARHRQDHKIEFLGSVCKGNKHVTFLDIGANYGEFCVALRKFADYIIAVEANPRVAGYLAANLGSTDASSAFVKILPSACTASHCPNSQETFIFDSSYSGGSRLISAFGASNFLEAEPLLHYGRKRSVQVPTVDITYLLQACNPSKERTRKILVKIDVEGSEAEILHGIYKHHISTSLEQQVCTPLAILFEYNQNSHSESEQFLHLIEQFLAQGFECYSIDASIEMFRRIGPQKISALNQFNPSRDQDVFLCSGFSMPHDNLIQQQHHSHG